MSRCAEFEPAVMESARKLLNTAKTVREMRTAQAILLPAIFGLIREQTATAIGLSVSRIGGIQEMGAFLQQVGARYPDDHILMVVDGASSHKAMALQIPDNISLVLLPAYSPQLNPQENVWDEVREKNFPNRVFSTMAAVHEQLQAGLAKSVADTKRVTSLTAWPWIRNILS
jgi:transposase